MKSFTDYASGIRLPDCSKLAAYWKNGNEVTIFQHEIIVKFFDVGLFFLSSLVTGPSLISISPIVLEFWRDWPEIGNIPVWVLPNIWRLRRVRNTIFGMNVSNEMLLNVAKCQGYSFYRFWVITGKPIGGVKLHPTQIRVKKKKKPRNTYTYIHRLRSNLTTGYLVNWKREILVTGARWNRKKLLNLKGLSITTSR